MLLINISPNGKICVRFILSWSRWWLLKNKYTALYSLYDMNEDDEILFSVFDYWGSRESWTLEVK